MATRLAINGFGRIGRTVARIALTRPDIEIVAVNDLTNPGLLRFDSVHGRLEEPVTADDGHLVIGDRGIPALREREPPAWTSTSWSGRPASSPTASPPGPIWTRARGAY
ncbi:glyceraldehyde 3-phosphate dehydrogenase NAD-binding domain-containing protein [Streptomyces sp. NPDC047072]|uniref:glyceraldehyde 3-phosphate dehydrogenase NAD-binding domain-containing protein n=1 Tax=Streptomyces sp. NPDC047072 TaxID=3154809 RepID=UPI0033F7DC11